MPLRTKALILLTVTSAGVATVWSAHTPSHSWWRFSIFLATILLSSGMKVVLPRGEGSMSLNFPFILLAIVQLSPLQAILLAAMSVAAQCRVRVKKLFTAVQIAFNVSNSIASTACAFAMYAWLSVHGMAVAPALSLAAVMYFLCNTTMVALVIAWSKGERAFALWKAEFPWYLPFYLVGAALAALADGLGARYGVATSVLLVPMVYTIYRAYTAQIVRAKERQQHLEETEALHLRTIEGLAMAIEAKDQETHDHLFRVRSYVAEVGAVLGLCDLEKRALHTAALLHDIGKLAVPEHIINKPGKLTPEEFEKMKIHPVVGADILERVRFPYPVVPIVRAHHEWWNGQGYPDGLKGEEIPIGARILTVVDCFDALTSDRPYRKGKTLEEAMGIVRSLAGTQFDPAVVAIFQENCVQIEKQVRHGEIRTFVPLNTEVQVWRGASPGAGFEAQAAATKGTEGIDGGEDDEREVCAALLQRIAAASQEAQTLFEISQSPGNVLSLKETVSVTASRLRRLIPFDCCALYLKAGNTVVLQHVDGEQARCFSAQPIPMGEGISGWVAQSGRAILNGNAAVETSYHKQPARHDDLVSALSIPLFDVQGDVLGALTLYATKADSFSKDHLRMLHAMESKLSRSLQLGSPVEEAESANGTDVLTKLPNRHRLFVELETELCRSRRTGETVVVVICGLTSFQEVNDREGRFAGDRLLGAVAARFLEGCRSYDTVARLGGDEFVFLLPAMREFDVEEKLQAIAAMVAGACEDVRLKTRITASLGTSHFAVDGETAEELLAAAERRMHQRTKAHYKAMAEIDPRCADGVAAV